MLENVSVACISVSENVCVVNHRLPRTTWSTSSARSSFATDLYPWLPSSWTSTHSSLNFLHYSHTIPSLIRFSTWVILWWISAALSLSPCKNCIKLHNSHLAGESIIVAMFKCLQTNSKGRHTPGSGWGRGSRSAQSYSAQNCLQHTTSYFTAWLEVKKNSPRIVELNLDNNCLNVLC